MTGEIQLHHFEAFLTPFETFVVDAHSDKNKITNVKWWKITHYPQITFSHILPLFQTHVTLQNGINYEKEVGSAKWPYPWQPIYKSCFKLLIQKFRI